VTALSGSSAFNAIALHHFRVLDPPPGNTYAVNGRQMHIYCTGSGSRNDALIWGGVLPDLAKNTRIRAYDRAGKRVSLPGADFVHVEGDKIRSLQGYFNPGALPVALGLDVIIQPKAIGLFSFGTSVRAYGGSAATPGAFSITVLEARGEEEKKAVADRWLSLQRKGPSEEQDGRKNLACGPPKWMPFIVRKHRARDSQCLPKQAGSQSVIGIFSCNRG
jgi:hypothetical protein